MTRQADGPARVIPIISRRTAPSPGPPDAALVAACGSGDAGALGLLYDRHGEGVHRFLSRMSCVDLQDADDLLQDVFLAASRSAERYSGASGVRTWLLAIAANLAPPREPLPARPHASVKRANRA